MNYLEQLTQLDPQTIETFLAPAIAYGLNVLGALVILVVGWWVAARLDCWSTHLLQKAKMDTTLTKFLAKLLRYVVMAFTVVAVLNKFGVQTTSLIAVMGAAGLAIGLALQGTLSHVASGVMLLIFRPIKVGDFVEIGAHKGIVDEIGLFMTNIDTLDNVRITMPNSLLWDGAIINYSAHPKRRVDLTIGIGYEDDIGAAIGVVQTILKNDSRTLDKPEPLVAVESLGESSVDLTIRVWCKRGDWFNFKLDLTRSIKEGFDANGITIPYPQRVVTHIHTNAPSAPLSATSLANSDVLEGEEQTPTKKPTAKKRPAKKIAL